jgi:DNA-binding transcriptional regulator YiaG
MSSTDLSAFLKRHGLNGPDFAKLLGVTDMAVHQWLNGRRAISLPITRIIKLFDKFPEAMKEFGK